MISNLKNPWGKKKDVELSIIKQKEILASMAKKAQEILADDKFKAYKEMYQDYHAQEMENIMILVEEDPIKYAFKMRQIVDTLKAYRLLISSIEQDAQIKVED